MPTVRFEPTGTRIDVEDGASLLDAAHRAGVDAPECCGILPACAKCRVAVLEGLDCLGGIDELEAEARHQGAFLPFERVGCMASVHGDVTVELLEYT